MPCGGDAFSGYARRVFIDPERPYDWHIQYATAEKDGCEWCVKYHKRGGKCEGGEDDFLRPAGTAIFHCKHVTSLWEEDSDA